MISEANPMVSIAATEMDVMRPAYLPNSSACEKEVQEARKSGTP
jgi:hypothetical protein